MDSQERKGKARKRRKRSLSRLCRRRSSSRSTSSSRSSSSDFHLALGHSAGQENAIQVLARKSPGKLLHSGLSPMYRLCSPASRVTGGELPKIPAAALQYYPNIQESAQASILEISSGSESESGGKFAEANVRGNLARQAAARAKAEAQDNRRKEQRQTRALPWWLKQRIEDRAKSWK